MKALGEVWKVCKVSATAKLKVLVHKLITMTNCPSTVRHTYNWQLTSEWKCWSETSYSLKSQKSCDHKWNYFYCPLFFWPDFRECHWCLKINSPSIVSIFKSIASIWYESTKQKWWHKNVLFFPDTLERNIAKKSIGTMCSCLCCHCINSGKTGHKSLPDRFENDSRSNRETLQLKKDTCFGSPADRLDAERVTVREFNTVRCRYD